MKIKTIHFQTIHSTNEWAKQECHTFSKQDLTCIVADEQTAGKGRLGRVWHSPLQDNFYGTFCMYLNSPRNDLGLTSLVLALSVCEAVAPFGATLQLKWPNDLLLNKKKVGGILGESVFGSDGLFLILGLGLNINFDPSGNDLIDQPVTALSTHLKHPLSKKEIEEKIKEHFCHDLALFLERGFEPFFERYKNRLTLKPDQKIKLRHGINGVFVGLNGDGTLNVKLPSGEIKTISCVSLLESIE
jgi:BirA family biotin operon repressor/biotin-[acetyl-CoA-carboxylase] ligase